MNESEMIQLLRSSADGIDHDFLIRLEENLDVWLGSEVCQAYTKEHDLFFPMVDYSFSQFSEYYDEAMELSHVTPSLSAFTSDGIKSVILDHQKFDALLAVMPKVVFTTSNTEWLHHRFTGHYFPLLFQNELKRNLEGYQGKDILFYRAIMGGTHCHRGDAETAYLLPLLQLMSDLNMNVTCDHCKAIHSETGAHAMVDHWLVKFTKNTYRNEISSWVEQTGVKLRTVCFDV